MAWLEMRAATVMFPLKRPRWWYGIRRRGKPCINCAEISLQWGAFWIITLPKMSRRTPSKLLSNRSFPYLRFTPKGFPASWNMVSFDNSLLLCCDWSGEGSCSLHHASLASTYFTQYCLHSCRFAKSTSCVESPGNSPAGNRKLSYRNNVKLNSVMFSSDVARPRGKYGTIRSGSTSLVVDADGWSRSLSTTMWEISVSWDCVWLSRNDEWLLEKHSIHCFT